MKLADVVRRRANGLCEYCHVSESAYRRNFHMEHIIARSHGGSSSLDNLALACWRCNWRKGPNLSALDGDDLVPLFHPRRDTWDHHFAALTYAPPGGIEIRGLTPTGRATAHLLGFNEPIRQILRYQLTQSPPPAR